MITRGVASVRSPVRNLCWFNPDISHDAFVEAAIRAFCEEYGINEVVHEVDETEDLLSIPYIRDGMAELTVRLVSASIAFSELTSCRHGTGRLGRRQNSRTHCRGRSRGVKWSVLLPVFLIEAY